MVRKIVYDTSSWETSTLFALPAAGKLCIEVTPNSKIAWISEELCIGCGICVKKCPFEAIMIINLPKDLEKETTHRYGPNSFKLHRWAIRQLGGNRMKCLSLWMGGGGRQRCAWMAQSGGLIYTVFARGSACSGTERGLCVPALKSRQGGILM